MENTIVLKVLAEAGVYEDQFNVHQSLGHVIKKAMSHFGIDEKLYSQFEIMLNDMPLNNSMKINELGIDNYTQLLLHNKGPTVDGGI